MNTLKKLVLFLACAAFALCLYTGFSVYASDSSGNLTLHERTKIYSQKNNDYFDGCEDFDDYKYSKPAITVLTHGFGGNASGWSNNPNCSFDYNEKSLVTKIVNKHNNTDVYVASCKSETSFNLCKYTWNEEFEHHDVSRIDDASRHIVLIFESGAPSRSNKYVYHEFENVLDNISLQYKSLTGVLPRYNLVGHSRGGLTNIMYATDHPYNVADIYSLGTPYNGSVLGGCDFILEMLGYKIGEYEDGSNRYVEGVESLLSQNEINEIRKNWNEAYKSDVTCHVVALGSATSISFLDAFVKDIANSNTKYKDIVYDYVDLVSFITTLINILPHTTEFTLDLVEGWANICSFFNHNVYDDIVAKFNEEWKGDITVKEGNKILELYSVLDNNEPVLLDDLFIDVNSQLGYFSEVEDYKGFNRYLKVFEPKDLTEYRAIPDQPAVVHNLEVFNSTYTDYISKNLVYGSFKNKIQELDEIGSFSGVVDGEKLLQFDAYGSGYRKIAVNCQYTVCQKNGSNVDITDNVVYLEDGVSYYIVLKTDKATSVNLTIDVAQLYGTVTNFSYNHRQIFYINNLSNGFYRLVSTDNNAKFFDLEGNQISYIYSSGTSDKNYVVVEATQDSISLSTSVPVAVNPDSELHNFSKNEILSLTNNYTIAVNYEIIINSSANIVILDSSNHVVSTSYLVESHNKTYYVTLTANQKIYILPSTSIQVKIKLADNQLFWYKSNQMITSNILEVTIGSTCKISLKLRNNKTFEYVTIGYVVSNSGYGVSMTGSTLKVSTTAQIGKSVVISHKNYNSQLEVLIIPSRNLNLTINNGNDISLNWNTSYGSNQITRIDYELICDGKVVKQENMTALSGIVDLSVLTASKFTLNLTRVYFENGSFPSSYFVSISRTINSYYGSGNGSSSDPYTISCERHLKNISKNNSYSFKITSNISLSTWQPISSFSGSLDGDGHVLYYMSIDCGQSGDYGLFATSRGTIKNLTISHATLTTYKEKCSSRAGFFCGKNNGTIEDCSVQFSTIVAKSTSVISSGSDGSCFGGIAGHNYGTIKSTRADNLTMEVSGIDGGIAGYNSGTINSCGVAALNMTYTYVKPSSGNYWDYNGRVGGIAGYNKGTISKSDASGKMYWYNDGDHSGDNNRDIYPSMGHIVGMNASGASVTECSANMEHKITYYYWNFIGWYDQSGRCFRFSDQLIGHQE